MEVLVQLRELMRFRRTDAGNVPMEILRQLQLPMPDDVLEQFVCDHGTKPEFQTQYGHLDLHALGWRLIVIPARKILACSVYDLFADHVAIIANRVRRVAGDCWSDACLPLGAAEHWQNHNTWMRPPVLITGALVKSNSHIHLIEGHTRIGALRGLVESGVLSDSSNHQVWLGDVSGEYGNRGAWLEVLKTERVSFRHWLMRRVGDPAPLNQIASELILKDSHSSRKAGDDLEAILAFARATPQLANTLPAIVEAHKEWARFVRVKE
jgi:hypothetical protein